MSKPEFKRVGIFSFKIRVWKRNREIVRMDKFFDHLKSLFRGPATSNHSRRETGNE